MAMLVFTLGASVCPARADTIEIQFMNFPLHYGTYNGSQDFYDSVSPSGGNGILSQATPMGTVTVSTGTTGQTYSTGQVYGDLLISDLTNLNSTGSTTFNGDANGNAPPTISGTFGFDLLTTAGPLLNLNFNNSDISGFYAASGSGSPYVLGMGGLVTTIPLQNLNLPGGLVMSPESTSISFSGTSFSNVVTSGGQVVSFDVNVTGTISGTLVTPAPEPSTIVLLGIGAISLLAYGWRRRGRTA
jgi:hypothetical protein